MQTIGPFSIGETLASDRLTTTRSGSAPDGAVVHVRTLGDDVVSAAPDAAAIGERFAAAGEKWRSLAGPSYVHVWAAGSLDGAAAIVTRPQLGGPLAARLTAGGKLPLGEGLALIDAVLEAVGEAHRAGIAHGGLHPGCVYSIAGRVQVGDFALAEVWEPLSPDAPGTFDPAYLSPQQAEGKTGDVRADVFALGVLAYRMLTGAHPYGAEGLLPAEAAARASSVDPVDPRTYLPNIADHVRDTLLIALARNLTERFADALTMKAALRGESRVALETPTIRWAVREGAPEGEVTEGMAEFMADAPPAAEVPLEGEEPPAGAGGEPGAPE